MTQPSVRPEPKVVTSIVFATVTLAIFAAISDVSIWADTSHHIEDAIKYGH